MTDDLLTPRQRRAGRTRSVILNAALDLLAQVGLENLSLREVARLVDYSPAAIYEYFESKEVLLAALFSEADSQLNAALEKLPQDISPGDHLIAVGASYINFARQNPRLYQLFVTPPSQSWIEASVSYHTLIRIVRAGIACDEFKPRTGFGAQEMAFGFWALMHGLASLQSRLSDNFSGDKNLLNLIVLEAMVRGLQYTP